MVCCSLFQFFHVICKAYSYCTELILIFASLALLVYCVLSFLGKHSCFDFSSKKIFPRNITFLAFTFENLMIPSNISHLLVLIKCDFNFMIILAPMAHENCFRSFGPQNSINQNLDGRSQVQKGGAGMDIHRY